MAKSEKSNKTTVISKIVILKINNKSHIKVLQKGDKAVVREGGNILFNNLKTRASFDKWWKTHIDGLSDNIRIDVVKNEVVKNEDMDKIHEKYK